MKATLKQPHEHRGIIHPAGATLDVTPAQKTRLQRAGKVAGKPVDTTKETHDDDVI